jgi:hypothetical protein
VKHPVNHALSLLLVVTLGVFVLPKTARGEQLQTVRTRTDTYLYHVEHDTSLLPDLLDVPDSVALLSWARFAREGDELSGSLVLRRNQIHSIREYFRGEPLHRVQHKYVVPHPEGWRSFHLSSYRRNLSDDRPWFNKFTQLPFPFKKARKDDQTPAWPEVRESFAKCGRSLGNFFHVTLHCARSDSTSDYKRSMSYAFFQRTPRGALVIGDLVTEVDQLSPVIHYLYRNDMIMLSLAHNRISEDQQLYFIHFAGVGSPELLAPRLRTLEKLSGSKQ